MILFFLTRVFFVVYFIIFFFRSLFLNVLFILYFFFYLLNNLKNFFFKFYLILNFDVSLFYFLNIFLFKYLSKNIIITSIFSCLNVFFYILLILVFFIFMLIWPVKVYFIFIDSLIIILPILLSVAFLTLLERKILAFIQRRKGPNVVGWYGILQSFADAVKLIFKEPIYPAKSNFGLFLSAPIITFTLSLLFWSIFPFYNDIVLVDLDISLLLVFAISSFGVYGIIIAGWSSNSKYAFLGALRSSAQMISYEVSFGIILLSILIFTKSFNLTVNVLFQEFIWFFFPFLPSFVMFFISILAETSRTPFDLPEAESELVSGYNVEYSSVGFVLFFISEYANIIFMNSLLVILFFGGWMDFFNLNFYFSVFFFVLKIIFFLFVFIWIRSVLPRYRYDQLMYLGWKVLLPVSLGFFFFYLVIYLIFFFY